MIPSDLLTPQGPFPQCDGPVRGLEVEKREDIGAGWGGGRVPVGVEPLMVQLGMFYGGLALVAQRKSTFSNRKYIFIHAGFSIALLVYWRVVGVEGKKN